MHKKTSLFATATIAAIAISAATIGKAQDDASDKNDLSYISDGSPVGKERLDATIDPLFEAENMQETRALLIMHGGEIVAERYGEGYDADTRFVSWSMAKSVTSVLVGFLVSDGRLVLDDPAPIPAWQRPGDPRGNITLRQLLHMASGLDHSETPADGVAVYEAITNRMLFLDGAADMAAFAEARPPEAEPGQKFEYSTATSIILTDIVTRTLTGSKDPTVRRDAMLEFMRGRLFEPLGMDSAVPEFDAAGTFIGGSLMHATARDWAKFGEFLRHKGSKKGSQHLPTSWVNFMREPSPTNPVYGGHIWLNRIKSDGTPFLFPNLAPQSLFAMMGHLGQFVMISPEQKLTVVRLGKTQDDVLEPVKQQVGQIFALFPKS